MICLSLELSLFGWKQESIQIKGTGEEREWVDERVKVSSVCDGNLHLSLPILADFTGRRKQWTSDRVSDPAGLEDSKGSFNYYAGYTSFLLKNIMPTCRFWGLLFKNEVCTPSSLHFRWKRSDSRNRYSNFIDLVKFQTGRDWYTFFFPLVTRETEVFKGNWLGQDDILTSDYRCNLCAFCSTLKLLLCCTYTETLTFSSGSLPRLGTGGTWKYCAAFPYQGQPPWGSVKVYSRWNCPCKAHASWGERLLLCSHYSASLYKGIHHSLSFR